MKNIMAIIWDYNGTLLDDTENAVKSINIMLTKRGLPILSRDSYREVFSFPVKEHYEKIGFDFAKEDWGSVGSEFISLYNSFLSDYSIFPEAKRLVNKISKQNKKQFILSSMEQSMLDRSVEEEGIREYFSDILGTDDIYAGSKLKNGKKLLRLHRLIPDKVCFLGDTTHDYEVANELGCQCILIAAGHQSLSGLRTTGCSKIVENIQEINLL